MVCQMGPSYKEAYLGPSSQTMPLLNINEKLYNIYVLQVIVKYQQFWT